MHWSYVRTPAWEAGVNAGDAVESQPILNRPAFGEPVHDADWLTRVHSFGPIVAQPVSTPLLCMRAAQLTPSTIIALGAWQARPHNLQDSRRNNMR